MSRFDLTVMDASMGGLHTAGPRLTDLPDSFALPSVITVVLSGANADGAEGLPAIKAKSGTTLVQEPGGADHAPPLDGIPVFIANPCNGDAQHVEWGPP